MTRYAEAEDIYLKTAMIIGVIQCLALIPGTSRSGSTIIGSLFLGVSRKAQPSFLSFGHPCAGGGRGLLDLAKNHAILTSTQDWGIMASLLAVPWYRLFLP